MNYNRVCNNCEHDFITENKHYWQVRYCSDECRRQIANKRNNLRSKVWREKYPDKVSACKKACYQKKIGEYKERSRLNGKKMRRLRKWCVMTFYSGAKFCCACCGETALDFLTIDHINNNGNKHRKDLFGKKAVAGDMFYNWLIKNNYPSGYQVLCFNCNIGKSIHGGLCPHKEVQIIV